MSVQGFISVSYHSSCIRSLNPSPTPPPPLLPGLPIVSPTFHAMQSFCSCASGVRPRWRRILPLFPERCLLGDPITPSRLTRSVMLTDGTDKFEGNLLGLCMPVVPTLSSVLPVKFCSWGALRTGTAHTFVPSVWWIQRVVGGVKGGRGRDGAEGGGWGWGGGH